MTPPHIIGSLLRAAFGSVGCRKSEARMLNAIERLNTASEKSMRRMTLADVLDDLAKARSR